MLSQLSILNGIPHREALLYKKIANNAVICLNCARYCAIQNGKRGFCNVRENIEGSLYSLNWGNPGAINIDPIEKKPFFNFKPSSLALSLGSPGCNFTCSNCQNWTISQAIDDVVSNINIVSPNKLAELSLRHKCESIAFTYTEPTVSFDYVKDAILAVRELQGNDSPAFLFVTNGFFSEECFNTIVEENLLDAIRIDLKFISDEKYRRICSSSLLPVLDNIRRVYNSGIHLEIINLVIPDENNSKADIRALCEFIAKISTDIPLHFSRFFPQYKMSGKQPTKLEDLLYAYDIAIETGLNYVYLGNVDLPGKSDTYCPKCHSAIIKRHRYEILEKNYSFDSNGNAICDVCGNKVNIRK